MWLMYLKYRSREIHPIKVRDSRSATRVTEAVGVKDRKKLVVHALSCIFGLCTCTWGNERLLQILTVALRSKEPLVFQQPKSSYFFSFHFIWFSSSPAAMLL